jgi:hypothetical protein
LRRATRTRSGLGTGEEDAATRSPGGGIYKSTDGGMTWSLMGLEKTEHIGRIVVHPTNPDVVWVAAIGRDMAENPERGLYKTTDGGRTWQLKKFISDRAGFIDVVIHPHNPDVLFAASWERIRGPYFAVERRPRQRRSGSTTDGGETWTEVTGGGFPATMKGRIGIDIALSDPDIMYALVEAESPDGHDPERLRGCRASKAGGCGLYRSEDGGATWTWMAPQNVRPFYYSQVRVDPSIPTAVYWSSTPVSFSTDGGRTVRRRHSGLHVDHHAMWIDPNDPQRMIVGNDGGIGVSLRPRRQLHLPEHVPDRSVLRRQLRHGDAVQRVCGGLQDNGTWCGPSRKAGAGASPTTTGSRRRRRRLRHRAGSARPGARLLRVAGRQHGPATCRPVRPCGVQKPNCSSGTPHVGGLDRGRAAGPGRGARARSQRRIDEFRRNQARDSADYVMRYNWNTPFFLSPHNPDVFYAGANRVLKSVLARRRPAADLAGPVEAGHGEDPYQHADRRAESRGRDGRGDVRHHRRWPSRRCGRGMLAAGTDDGNVWISDGRRRQLDGPDARSSAGWCRTPATSAASSSRHTTRSRFYVTFDDHRNGDFSRTCS